MHVLFEIGCAILAVYGAYEIFFGMMSCLYHHTYLTPRDMTVQALYPVYLRLRVPGDAEFEIRRAERYARAVRDRGAVVILMREPKDSKNEETLGIVRRLNREYGNIEIADCQQEQFSADSCF